jgi:hypothetical protein
MRVFFAVFAVLMIVGAAANAQSREQQVYYPPYITNSGLTQQDLVNRQNYIIAQEQARLEADYHVERNPYSGMTPGRIPQHPGDYRDALDRGELPSVGTSYKIDTPFERY